MSSSGFFPISFFIVLFSFSVLVSAQEYDHAGEYMEEVNDAYDDVRKRMWRYTKSITNEHNQNRIERRHDKVLEELKEAESDVRSLPSYEGNTKYRDSVVAFLDLSYTVLNNDFEEIMDLKEIKRKSYSQMEAYYAAQNKANKKLADANARLQEVQREFADNHDINLKEERTKRQKRLEQANEMFDYYEDVYLIFYKPFREEQYFLEAAKNENINKMQQHKSALLEFAKAGLDTLQEYEPFEGDHSLVNACKTMLRFYKREAKHKFDDYIEYQLQKEKFMKMKKAMENKSKSERTKEEVEKYNKGVKEYNKQVKSVKRTKKKLQSEREEKMENWDETSSDFKDDHVNTGFFDWD